MVVGPQTFFDALATLDVGSRFEPLTESQLDALGRYHQLAGELGTSTFFSGPVRLSVKASAAESYERLEHAGFDPLRSMTMSFRQLWMSKEPTRFHAILNILRSAIPTNGLGSTRTRAVLDHLGRRHRHARAISLMKHVRVDDPMGRPIREFTAEQVIDDWLYGGAFHFDPDAAERVASWSPNAYEWSLIKAITAVAGVCWELDLLVGAILEQQRPSALAA